MILRRFSVSNYLTTALASLVVCLVSVAAWAGADLPVPRYVSLRAGEVNLRTGPGVRYPVEWVFQRRSMPVEILAEFETWRKVRDWEGTEGWVHQSMLSGRRFVVIAGEVRQLRDEPRDAAATVARLEPGVIGELYRCRTGEEWCRIEVAGRKGWLRRAEVWGVYTDEEVK